MISFLKNNYRAKRLYGTSVDGACQGIHRLMISGVVLQWYMEYSKKNDVDDNIRSGDLCHMLSTVGVLRPTQTQQPKFSSIIIPVHTLLTAEAGVLAVIRSGMSVALVPPKHFITSTPTSQEYREYYNSHIAAMTSTAVERAVQQFKATSTYVTDFSTSPCLFPIAPQPIVDVAVVNKDDYIRLEGQRMVGKVKDAVAHQKAAQQQQRELTRQKNTGNREHPSPLKQTTLKYTADGQLGLAEAHQPRIVSMAQLQAIRKAQQAFSEYVLSEMITSSWSSYNGSEGSYLDRLEFHVVQDRQLVLHDDMVLLFHETSDTKDNGHVLDPSHVHYRIVLIAGSVLRLDFVALLHTNCTRSGDAGDIPPKLTITICNEYILLRTRADGNQQQNQLAELQSTSLRQEGTSSSRSGPRSLHRASQSNTSGTDQSLPIPDGTGGAASW